EADTPRGGSGNFPAALLGCGRRGRAGCQSLRARPPLSIRRQRKGDATGFTRTPQQARQCAQKRFRFAYRAGLSSDGCLVGLLGFGHGRLGFLLSSVFAKPKLNLIWCEAGAATPCLRLGVSQG